MENNQMDTSEPDVIAEALRRPSGAHFVRCALQVNPHHYRAGAAELAQHFGITRQQAENIAGAGESTIMKTTSTTASSAR
ncbi:MAG: hypothetical protein OXF64_06110 [bacterium]|nr:hypothetical protein [bacterium]MCY4273557.1 hypothetical protein [bacterium]